MGKRRKGVPVLMDRLCNSTLSIKKAISQFIHESCPAQAITSSDWFLRDFKQYHLAKGRCINACCSSRRYRPIPHSECTIWTSNSLIACVINIATLTLPRAKCFLPSGSAVFFLSLAPGFVRFSHSSKKAQTDANKNTIGRYTVEKKLFFQSVVTSTWRNLQAGSSENLFLGYFPDLLFSIAAEFKMRIFPKWWFIKNFG